jgi:single-strand DNA-binding protein
MNQLNAIGNIGQSAELRFLPDSTPVAQFSFALQAGYGDKQVTTWLRCSIFGKRAETLSPMLTKGTRIGITGELTNRPYTDKQGQEKYSLELRVSDVTLLGAKSDAIKNAVENLSESQKALLKEKIEQSDGVKEAFDNFEDDIPF